MSDSFKAAGLHTQSHLPFRLSSILVVFHLGRLSFISYFVFVAFLLGLLQLILVWIGLVCFTRPTVTTCRVGFSLDRTKQLKKLRKDSAVNNYEVEISPNNENVNIYCSVGFYTKIAIPTFETLTACSTISASGVTVLCHDVTKRTDATGAATTTVIMFRLCHDKLSVGQVTVHLHHSTRNVQLQGSALLPDNTTAPVWFVENILKDKFKIEESQAKDISKFNQSVSDMVTKHFEQVTTKNTCAGCKSIFNGRCLPIQCPQCTLYYHTKCYPSTTHSCQVRRRTASCTTTLRGGQRARDNQLRVSAEINPNTSAQQPSSSGLMPVSSQPALQTSILSPNAVITSTRYQTVQTSLPASIIYNTNNIPAQSVRVGTSE